MVTLPRRHAAGLAFAALCAVSPLGVSPLGAAETVALKEAAAARGLSFGAAPETDLTAAPAAYRALLAEHCALLAPILPWTAVSVPDGEYRFGPAGVSAIAFARERGMQLTGSHLLWHEWTPAWFASLSPARAGDAARRHVVAMVSRYAGQVHAWNVVNEALQPDHGRPDGLRATALLGQLGSGFIGDAFHAARAADPRALLLYNDYSMEAATRHHEAKRVALLGLVDRLRGTGAPIGGVGLQSHLDPAEPFEENRYRAFLREIAVRGLRIVLTELDVRDTRTRGDTAARDREVASWYARFLAVALDERAVVAVVCWGLSDGYSWQNEGSRAEYRRSDGQPARPLPFDAVFRPKPAYRAILDALRAAPDRRA